MLDENEVHARTQRIIDAMLPEMLVHLMSLETMIKESMHKSRAYHFDVGLDMRMTAEAQEPRYAIRFFYKDCAMIMGDHAYDIVKEADSEYKGTLSQYASCSSDPDFLSKDILLYLADVRTRYVKH